MISLCLGAVDYKREEVGCVGLVLAYESTRPDQRVCRMTCNWDLPIVEGISSFQGFVVFEKGTCCHEHQHQLCKYLQGVVGVVTGQIGMMVVERLYCELRTDIAVACVGCCPCDCESRCRPCESLSDQLFVVGVVERRPGLPCDCLSVWCLCQRYELLHLDFLLSGLVGYSLCV